MTNKRMRRVDELLKRELGILCERHVVSELKCLMTITKVKTSPDLRNAQVFFSVLGDDEDWAATQASLDQHRVALQSGIASVVKLKYTPVLHFKPDTIFEQADRVFSIIDKLDLPSEENNE